MLPKQSASKLGRKCYHNKVRVKLAMSIMRHFSKCPYGVSNQCDRYLTLQINTCTVTTNPSYGVVLP